MASPSSGTFASSVVSGSGSDASARGSASQSGSVHNTDDTPAHASAAAARTPVNGDLPDDGTRGDVPQRSAKPDLGWPALLPGSIW